MNNKYITIKRKTMPNYYKAALWGQRYPLWKCSHKHNSIKGAEFCMSTNLKEAQRKVYGKPLPTANS